MYETITLFNVKDIRNDQFYSIAIVREKDAKYFIPVLTDDAEDSETTEEIIEETSDES